jgi:hypothetical protein
MNYREKRFKIERDGIDTYRVVENRGRFASGVIRLQNIKDKKTAEERVRALERGRAA